MKTSDYRANYDPAGWEKIRAEIGEFCVPFGAILAISALCDEVDRLQAQLNQVPRDAKRCPHCGDHNLVHFRTCQHEAFEEPGYRHCSNCGADIPWHLEDGQPPLIGSNRTGRRLPA